MEKRDARAYNQLWEAVIAPAINSVLCDGARLRLTAKEDIWCAYQAFNLHSSENYMVKSVGRIDRHKVAACYTYAIMVAMPIVVEEELVASHLNERVALVVGCSVLANFVSVAAKKSGLFTRDRLSSVLRRIREGVRFPNPVGHGTYVDSILNCLALTQIEKNYNVLLLAILYYDWELWLIEPEDHEKIVEYYKGIGD